MGALEGFAGEDNLLLLTGFFWLLDGRRRGESRQGSQLGGRIILPLT